MEDLVISVDDGFISGRGRDIVGEFTLAGRLEQGQVAILKQYIQQHSVEYVGTYDGEGTMSGMWRIWAFSGKWLIRFAARADADASAAANGIREIVPISLDDKSFGDA